MRNLIIDLTGKDLITTQDWKVDELKIALGLAKELKETYHYFGLERLPPLLDRKTFFMLFFAPSTRTRAAFEAAMTYLGGHAQYIESRQTRAGEGEAVKDIVAMYDRYGHGLGIRILDKAIDFRHGVGNQLLREAAKHVRVPVINMADDQFHPTQALGDYMTFEEKFPNPKGKKYVIMWAYSPHVRGPCSVNADLLLFTRMGVDVTVAYPPGFDLYPDIVNQAKANAESSGAVLEFTNDYKEALRGAHAVFPRNWASQQLQELGYSKFGEEELRTYEKFKDWKVTSELMDLMDKSGVLMHVMPIMRGYEADDEVVDSPRSVLYEQAENGMWAKAAVLALTMAYIR